MTHFYLTLPSNSSMNYYPTNTLTRFTTRLQQTVSLSDEWEVGLAEISFPKSWYTIPKGGGVFTVSCTGCNFVRDYSSECKITPGYYDSVADVVAAFHKETQKLALISSTTGRGLLNTDHYYPTLKYSNSSKKVHFEMMRNQTLRLSTTLAQIFGLGPKQNPLTV